MSNDTITFVKKEHVFTYYEVPKFDLTPEELNQIDNGDYNPLEVYTYDLPGHSAYWQQEETPLSEINLCT